MDTFIPYFGLILDFFGAGDCGWWGIVPRRDLNEQLFVG